MLLKLCAAYFYTLFDQIFNTKYANKPYAHNKHLYFEYDTFLLSTILLLLSLGLLMVFSASTHLSEIQYGLPFYYGLKQSISMVLGLCLLFLFMILPLSYLKKTHLYILILSILSLILVLLIGHKVNGSIRWLPLGFFNIQPSEFSKIGFMIYLSAYLSKRQNTFYESGIPFIFPILLLTVFAVLLLAEPDFGSTMVLTGAVMGLLFLAGVHLKYFTWVLSGIFIGFIIIVFREPYRVVRLITYLDPWNHPFDSGYQLTQALIAVGRGGWHGTGLGQSIQKLSYLPEAHTDFIFSIISEEFGLLGSAIVLILLLTLICKAFQIGLHCNVKKAYFLSYLAYSIALLWTISILMNIGVNLGLLPTKGLALPFFSYGGSHILANCCMSGLLLRIDYEIKKVNLSP